LAILAGVSARALRRNSATSRYNVLVVIMALSVSAPVATWLLQPGDLSSGHAAQPVALVPEVKPEVELVQAIAVAPSSEEQLTAPPGKPARPNEDAATLTPPITLETPAVPEEAISPGGLVEIQSALRPWLVWIVAGWGLGVALCSLRPLLGWHMLRRLRRVGISPATDEAVAALRRVSHRLGLRRAVQIWQSTLTHVPVVVGYLRPVVLLPVSLAASLPVSQLEAILAHELAHVRRHDFLVNLLQTLVETLFFYHPAVWWLSRRIRVEREHCCDDLVVALLGDRVEYGRALVAIEQVRGGRPLLALGAADGSLLARVRRIVGLASDPLAIGRRDRLPLALLAMAICGLALGLSMVWTIAASDAAATDKAPVKLSATLPNGATVELAGVGYHNWTRRDWWQADGKPLAKAPRDEALREVRLSETSAGKRQGECREFAIRISGLPKRKELFGYQFTFGTLTDAPARAVMYEPTEFRTAQLPAPSKPEIKTGTLRVGMDELPEEVLRSFDKDGKKLGKAPALEALRKADAAMQMVRAEAIDGQTQLLLKEIPRGSGPLVDEGVPLAIDKEGKRHESMQAGGRPGFVAYLYPVQLDQVVRFEYRLRLYRHWVTFENVSLHSGEATEVKIRVESVSEKRRLTAAERAVRTAEVERLRAEGREALARGDYQAMAKTYQTLSRAADADFTDAVWHGHSLHIVGKWQDAREAFQRAISLADQRLAELEQMTEPEPEEDELEAEDRRVRRGPVRDWKRERDRERQRICEEWPKLVLIAGQVELMLGDVESAVKTLSRGMRFAPEVESLEKLTEAARAALAKPPGSPSPLWYKLMMPIATQHSLALAHDKRGDHEAAARSWCRIHLSHLAYQVGMAELDADHLVKVVSRLPAAKRQPFHELVLANPGTRRVPKPQPFDYQEALRGDARNPFQVLAKLEGFQPTKLGPSRSTLAKLPSGNWVMAFTGGDAYQARIYLSSSADGKNWSPPWEFAHNNIFPTRSPSLIVDEDGLLWMLCTSKRFELSRYSSSEYRLWLCSSRDGRDWSPLRPVKTTGQFSGQYQQTALVTRDRTGKYWIISPNEIGSADSLAKLIELETFKLADDYKHTMEDMHATFDERNRCHLVFSASGIYYTNSTNMVDWTPPVKLDGQKNQSIGFPQSFTDGDRILTIYESGHDSWLRPGRLEGDGVTWSERIPIGLPLHGALAARDGDRLLLPSGRIGNGAPPVLLVARVPDLLKLAVRSGPHREARDTPEPNPPAGVVEKLALDALRIPYEPDLAKGSWQGGAHEMRVLLALGAVRPQDRVVKTLLTVVDRSEKSSLGERRLAMLYLSGHAPLQVKPLLIKELEQAVETPKEMFSPYHEIDMLGRMGELGEDASDAMPILIKLLDYPEGPARGAAIEALVKIGPTSAEVLAALAKKFDDPQAVYQAGRYGELAKPLGPQFVKLLDSKSKQIRVWAAYALVKSKFDEARGFDELMKDVASGTPEDRGLAATALAALGSQARSMIPKLRAYENDSDSKVAKEVRDAIRRIEIDERIFTHAEVAAKNAAARRAATEAVGKDPAVREEARPGALPDVRLAGDEVTEQAIERLAGKALGTVTLADAKLSGAIVERLRHVASIRSLRLFGTGLSGQIPRLEHVPGLEELELGTPLLGRDLEAIGRLTNLKRLSLPQELTINVSGAREIARLTRLTSLRLYNVNIDDAAFVELRTLVGLTELDLTHTRITDEGLATIEKMPRLKVLELHRHPNWHTSQQLTDACLASIARLPELERLSLSGKITNDGLKQVARLPRLTSLMILSTDITADGLAALRDSSVESLILSTGQIGPVPAGIGTKAALLERVPGLAHLSRCKKLKSVTVIGKPLDLGTDWTRLLPDIAWSFNS
jgi:beta-lactamase regulating signal transducer with metallopeptidase domain/tetratricopeptide (TPR) repeat protein